MLGGQTRHPDAVVGVDAGSTDASAAILAESLGADRVVSLPAGERAPGFGEAVAAGLASGVLRAPADEAFDSETTEWVWLLHDDSAPAADCLAELLRAADEHPRAAILGPKALGWHDRRLLIEVGFSISGSGRRVTGLDRREHDQGQHDDRSAVHAVGTAGMLVRRDAWDALGGMDSALPLYRDDLDLCWRTWRAGHEVRVVPPAVIHHREASYHGRREGSTEPGRGHRLDRRSAMHVLLAQTPAWRVPFTALRLAIGSAFRSVLYLLGKDLRRAGDEIAATTSLLTHPGRIAESRRHIKATSTMTSHQAVSEFRPKALSQARAALEAFGGMLAAGRSTDSTAVGALESGPVSDDADMFEDPAGGVLRRILGRPSVVLVLTLLVASLIAGRSLWWGDGVLFGGALLPAPDGAADLWGTYVDAWHDVGPGSTVPTAPLTALLAAMSTLLFGKAPLAVGFVLFLAVPLAGLCAWRALRDVVAGTAVRFWASFAYAFLPALAGAIAGGRLGTIVAVVLLPLIMRAVVRSVGLGCPPLPSPTGRTAWAAGLLLAIGVAGAPFLWPAALVALVAGVVAVIIRNGGIGEARGPVVVTALRALVTLVVPLLVLLPWSLYVLSHPVVLLGDLGLPDPALADPTPSAIDLVLLQPGGPGMVPAWAMAGLVIAALASVLRPVRRPVILACWGTALVALAFAIVISKVRVSLPGVPDPLALWPGMATAILGACLILAVAVAGDGIRDSVATEAFGWRQPVALVAGVFALLTPLVAGLLWLPGAGDPLRRGDPGVLPPFVVAEAVGPQAPRTLLLRQGFTGVSYALVNGAGPQLGEAEVLPASEVWQPLDALVAGLVSGRGGDEVTGLSAYAIRYVVLEQASPSTAALVRTLDSVPGLRRLAGQTGEVLWKSDGDTARVVLVAPDGSATPLAVTDVSSGDPLVSGALPSAGGGVLRVSQTADPGWQARVGDASLAAGDGTLQSFDVPAATQMGDALSISFDGSSRARWLWIELIAVIVVVVLALPGRRRAEDDDTAAESDEDVADDAEVSA